MLEIAVKSLQAGLRRAGGRVETSVVRRTVGRDGAVFSRKAIAGAATAPAPVSSVVHFDRQSPLIDRLLAKLGWPRPGTRAAVLNDQTYLRYSTDGKNWQNQPLQYLRDNHQGFVLRGLPAGTPIQAAIQAEVGVTHNGFRSVDDTHVAWLTTWGDNLRLTTEVNR